MRLPRSPGIYAIVHVASGRRYIGSAKDMGRRWWKHQNLLRRGNHDCHHLQRSWSKYGGDAFRIETVEICFNDPVILVAREQFWLDRHKGHLFNHRKLAEQFSAEWHQTEEGRAYANRKAELQAKKWASRAYSEKTCVECGRQFRSRNTAAVIARFCSNKCSCAHRYANRKMNDASCVICGSDFQSDPSRPAKTCSYRCRAMFQANGFKLDAAGAEMVRKMLADGHTGKSVATYFGLSTSQISRIKNGTRWPRTPSAPS